MANPWLKFYTSDWRSDPKLRMCSLAARGLWAEMICLMHEATPYGQLLINGQCPTDEQIARQVGAFPDEVTAALGELEMNGVFSRTRTGVIYSRKMSKMQKKAATARNNGRKGGNPSLRKEKDNPPSVKGDDKGGDKPQSPEARVQSKKEETKVSSKKDPPKRKTRIPEDAVISDRMIKSANKRGHSLPEAEAQFAKFKNNALANGKLFADWDRAFVTWLDSPYFKPALQIQPRLNGGNHARQPASTDPELESIARAARAR